MSKETIEWLNSNTLIGFTDKRGKAWHYREGSDNHYPGAVPVGEINRRLFHWAPTESPVFVRAIGGPNDGGMTEVPNRKAIVRPDTGDVLGIFTDNYSPHCYKEWLVGAVSNILGDKLSIGSAGLLRKGGVAWVQVEVPENITTPEGVEFRPNLLATTSLDGTVATTYKRTATVVVCDNTLALGMSERDGKYKIKHTKNSGFRIGEAREALAIIDATGDSVSAEIKRLCETTVTDKQWSAYLDATVPVPAEKGRAQTIAENKRGELTQLWNTDNRAAPWHGTAFGVIQAANTWQHHYSVVRGAEHRAERNMEAAIKGKTDQSDAATLAALGKVLATV